MALREDDEQRRPLYGTAALNYSIYRLEYQLQSELDCRGLSPHAVAVILPKLELSVLVYSKLRMA
jgi:hypothetical protein